MYYHFTATTSLSCIISKTQHDIGLKLYIFPTLLVYGALL